MPRQSYCPRVVHEDQAAVLCQRIIDRLIRRHRAFKYRALLMLPEYFREPHRLRERRFAVEIRHHGAGPRMRRVIPCVAVEKRTRDNVIFRVEPLKFLCDGKIRLVCRDGRIRSQKRDPDACSRGVMFRFIHSIKERAARRSVSSWSV